MGRIPPTTRPDMPAPSAHPHTPKRPAKRGPTKRWARRAHSVADLHIHLVFCTKYRRRVITPRVFQTLARSMRASATVVDASITAIEADGDHIHVLLTFPPRLSIARLVQRLKGASSRAVRAQRLPEVQRALWGRHFWSPSYCVVSCGGAPLEVVRTYVETQQTRAKRPKPRPSRTNTPPHKTGPDMPRSLHPHAHRTGKPPPGSPH